MGNPCKMGGANVSCGLADLDYVSAVEDAAAEAEMEAPFMTMATALIFLSGAQLLRARTMSA